MSEAIAQARALLPAHFGESVCDALEAADYIHHTMLESVGGHMVRAFTVRVDTNIERDVRRSLLTIGDGLGFIGRETGGGTPEYDILLFLNETLS